MNNLAAMIITYNEEANISRTLRALAFLSHVLVIDSGSTDRTRDIVKSFANTEIMHRDFDTFADQCNFGLKYLKVEWVLSLDADYIVTKKAESDILDVVTRNSDLVDACSFRFLYCIHGKPIRSALLPRRTCLYRRNKANYVNIGHGHRVVIDGNTKSLDTHLLHDDQKGIDIWFGNQLRYQMSEALMLKKHKFKETRDGRFDPQTYLFDAFRELSTLYVKGWLL